jgi:hypothetical protein
VALSRSLRKQRTVNPPIAPSLQLLLLFLEDVGRS